MPRILLTLCLLAVTAMAGPARADRTVTARPDRSRGAWEGWGCSLAWWANQFGARDDLADALFTTRSVNLTTDSGTYRLPGLGMNIVRYNIGGSGREPASGRKPVMPPTVPRFRQIEGFWRDGASDDPASASFNWSADANQRAMLLKAKARGADVFEAFSNAPMWWMCRNDSTAGSEDGGDNLRASSVEAFARYLAIVALKAREDWGIDFDAVEPFNEPSVWWWKFPCTQEGCHFDLATQEKVIESLRRELDRRGLGDVAIAASDENTVDEALKTWNTMGAAAKARVARVNVHGYYGQRAYRGPNRAVLHQAVSADGRPLWVSEYGERDGTGGTMARSIALDINEMHATAWVYWQPLDSGGWGLIQSNPGDNWIGPPNPRYSVLAQYSRHIRPGMTILQTDDPDTVAAYDADRHTLVLVTLNAGDDAVVSYDLSRFVAASAPVSRWLSHTGAGSAYAKLTDLPLTGGALKMSQPAGSVQTLEIQNVYLRSNQPYTTTDAVRALATARGLREPQAGDLARLDVSGPGPGGRIDKADAVLVARRALGLDDEGSSAPPAATEGAKMIRPATAWRDTEGKPIQAHGGGILLRDGVYYWYGEDKTFGAANRVGVSCYSSRDLVDWKNEGTALPSEAVPEEFQGWGVLERPKVLYNAATQKYVMWMHLDADRYRVAKAGVAVADRPTGPFAFLKAFRPVASSTFRDMNLFQDDDGSAYVFYAGEDNATMHIVRLNKDYTGPEEPMEEGRTWARAFIGRSREAPAPFKHAGRYYVITSGCTGWAPNVADIAVADNVLGPWKSLGNPCVGPGAETTFGAQSTFVFPAPGKPKGHFIFMADQWNSRDLADSRYVWLPFTIADASGAALLWQDEWDVNGRPECAPSDAAIEP